LKGDGTSVAQIAAARRNWLDWWAALLHLRGALAGTLTQGGGDRRDAAAAPVVAHKGVTRGENAKRRTQGD